MQKNRWIILCSICVCILAWRSVFADVPTTTGIVPGQIWYSEDPLVEGDTVGVHTAVWNGATTDLSARVEFYDQNVVLGTRDIVVGPQSLKDVSVQWKVTAGDHTIHATIVSSSITTAGKKDQVTLDHNSTAENHTFVAVAVKTPEGKDVKPVDAVTDQVAKVTEQVKDIVPTSVSTNLSTIDTVRASTYNTVATNKIAAQKDVDALNKSTPTTTTTTVKGKTTQVQSKAVDPTSATRKPIAYLRLFFFTVLSFIFGSKIVFYGLIILIIFLVLRFIYRKIRNR